MVSRPPTFLRQVSASLGGLAAAALVLAAGLGLGRRATADGAPAAPSLAAPQSLGASRDEISLGDGFSLRGVPTRMSVFWTDDTVEEVAAHYERAWSGDGLLVKRQQLDRVTAVSAIDSVSGVMRSVSIMDTGEDRLVVPNVSSVSQLPEFSPAGAPVPLPEGLSGFTAHRADEGSRATYVATYVSPLAPVALVAFYKREFTARGYMVEASGAATKEGVRTVEAHRGAERVTMSITDTSQAAGAREGSLVYIDHARSFGVTE